MEQTTIKEHFKEGVVLIQDLAWEIINSNDKDYVNHKARVINSLCNEFLVKINNLLDDKPIDIY
jgi:hypothetical protein